MFDIDVFLNFMDFFLKCMCANLTIMRNYYFERVLLHYLKVKKDFLTLNYKLCIKIEIKLKILTRL